MKSVEIMWNRLKSQVKSNQVKWNQLKRNEIKWHQLKSSEAPPLPPQSLLSNFRPYRYIAKKKKGRETIDKNERNISPLDQAPGLGLAWACRPLWGMFCLDLYIFNLFSSVLLLEEAVPMPHPRSRAPLQEPTWFEHGLFCFLLRTGFRY